MDNKNLQFEICEGYTLLTPKLLGPSELDHLPSFVEELLLQRKQDIVLSLGAIETVFSSHLTAFVQVYRLLKSFNLKFILVDISPAVLNVMQMTQLDSLLPLFLSLRDFRESRAQAIPAETSADILDFNYTVEQTPGQALAVCKGYMAFGDKVRDLQLQLVGIPIVHFDMTEVGYLDTRVLIMLADLATRSTVKISGASNVIRELFEQHRLQSKVQFLDA